MVALITLEEAKRDLRLDSTASDDDLGLKISAAHAFVMRHIKRQDVGAMSDDDISILRIAEMLVLRSLFDDQDSDPMTQGVHALLVGFRDPTLA